MALTKDEWEAKELLEDAIKVQLRIALQTQDPQSEAAQELARMHEKWIAIHWGNGYEEQEYLGLVQGYLNDPRFVSYYDSAAGEGATEFLVQAIESAHEQDHADQNPATKQTKGRRAIATITAIIFGLKPKNLNTIP